MRHTDQQPAEISLNKKYHSGTICKGVSNPHTSNALSGEIIIQILANSCQPIIH